MVSSTSAGVSSATTRSVCRPKCVSYRSLLVTPAYLMAVQNRPTPEDLPPHEQYILDVLLYCAQGSTVGDKKTVVATPAGVQPVRKGEKGEPLVVPVLLSTVESISHLRIFLPKDLRGLQARETAWRSVKEVERRFPDGIALLDPVQNMDIKDERFQELVQVRVLSELENSC
jgi:ATP-dependent RNA helicase DOB1